MARKEKADLSEKLAVNYYVAMAGCNSATELKQCSRAAVWFLEWCFITFTAGRHKLDRWKNVTKIPLTERYKLITYS